jgi:homoserine kinase
VTMTGFVSGRVRVSVPATSANLGPGFDALGLALGLRDVVTAGVAGDGVAITVSGEGADAVPLDDRHLVYRAMARAFDLMGGRPPGVRLACVNRIPHGRGLGSSAAAIVAGVCAARALVSGGSLLMDEEAVFALAAEIEGHPDNVAPATYGGFTIAYAEGGTFRASTVAVDPRVEAVVFVPATPVQTTLARSLLPERISHTDAAAGAGRAALLVAAMSGCPELLFDATRDWLHQEYRAPAMPETLTVVRELRADGLAAVVSGAGPSVLVLCDASTCESVAARAPAGWSALRPGIERAGASADPV